MLLSTRARMACAFPAAVAVVIVASGCSGSSSTAKGPVGGTVTPTAKATPSSASDSSASGTQPPASPGSDAPATGSASASRRPTPPASSAPSNNAQRWGVTLDDVGDLTNVVDSLKALPTRPTARVVFDYDQKPADYAEALTRLHAVADVMATPVDSSDTAKYTADAYKARFQDFLSSYGSETAIWEVGNEVNGEWTGPSADTAAKTAAAYDVVHAAGKPTALTLYYNPDCWSDQAHEMLPWTARWIPERVKQGVDYVLVSYYEKDCNGHRPDQAEWKRVFGQLRTMFPAAKLGFGEVGADQKAEAGAKAEYLTRYYTMPAPVSGFVGGYFWWYYAEDAVPYTRSPVWAALRAAMGTASSGR
ncbi:MAG: hypothetical protein HOV83_24435 [Catenulispora sp.]|nr:hypothetical protein [Catenulispora sp.]